MKLYLTREGAKQYNIQSKNQIYQKNASDKSIGYTSLLPRTFKTDLKTTINTDLTHAHPPTQWEKKETFRRIQTEIGRD